MIRAILLDLDDTIFDFHRSEGEALEKTLAAAGICASERIVKRYSVINDSLWKKLERAEITREELLVGRFKLLFDEIGIDFPAIRAREIYEQALSSSFYFIDGAEEMLKKLHTRYDLYLASNGTDSVQTGRIARAGIEKYFKGIFISQRLGYDKPSIHYFEECFKRIDGFSKETTIIVGDSPTSDILGGRRAGILTCRYNPKGVAHSEIEAHYEIRSLDELLPLLDSIRFNKKA